MYFVISTALIFSHTFFTFNFRTVRNSWETLKGGEGLKVKGVKHTGSGSLNINCQSHGLFINSNSAITSQPVMTYFTQFTQCSKRKLGCQFYNDNFMTRLNIFILLCIFARVIKQELYALCSLTKRFVFQCQRTQIIKFYSNVEWVNEWV